MRILEYIKKYGYNFVTGTITVLAYKDGVYTIKEQNKMLKLLEEKSGEKIKEANEIINTANDRLTRLQRMEADLTDKESVISTLNKRIDGIQTKIDRKDFDNYYNESNLKLMKERYGIDKDKLITEKLQIENDMREYIKKISNSSSFDWI